MNRLNADNELNEIWSIAQNIGNQLAKCIYVLS